MADFEMAIQLDDLRAGPYNKMGLAYYAQGLLKEAKEYYDKLSVWHLMCHILFESRSDLLFYRYYELAFADFNKAIELDQKDAASYACRGETYAATGEYHKAYADLDRAFRLNPEFFPQQEISVGFSFN